MDESCFDEEFLKAWNTSPASSSTNDAKEWLENLMLFLKGEVEGEERISLVMSGFGVTKGEDVKMPRKRKYNLETQRGKIPSIYMLLASSKVPEIKKPKCIFCDGKHVSSDCFNAQKLTLEKKEDILDQAVICENVLPVSEGPWLDELKDLGDILTDTSVSCESIQVLIGADIVGRLLTGKRKLLSSGLVAVETHLGWTLMGKVPQVNTESVNLAMTVTSLFVKESEIVDLSRLDVLGIKDPMEKKSEQERDLKTKEYFKETVKFNQDNHYEVY
ncbi:hypothetical protein AVEN_115216-1 [Araneus ventricosus]|uniref:Peptidase aspartic putative domain-containing protein n=1 Tax=Araneus ventricosus TaxID=182803 RepID=A0A4Y1ZYQ0_ARAVE|nr:hypothetical protein AVEN_115216-1 [Araneus ventricosus]